LWNSATLFTLDGQAPIATIAQGYDITQRKQTEEALHRTMHALDERIKELNCLYSISELVRRDDISQEKIWQESARLLSCVYRFPEFSACCITWGDCEYSTGNFKKTVWSQSRSIVVYGEQAGNIEVCYSEECEEAFLPEEVKLLNAVADLLGNSTERKRAVELQQRHQANMSHLLRLGELGEMASGLAHEINQPLCAIENYAQACLQLMEKKINPVQLGGMIKDIREQAERAGRIVHRIKGLVRKKPPSFEYAGIKDIIQKAVDLMSVEAKKRGLYIGVKVPDNLLPVYADFILIEQVILNLIRNGLEAMDTPQISKKELTIQAEAGSNSTIEVCISDTGCGISEENMKKIFESFFTTKSDGLGIGLSLSRAIINSHSGQLWATANADGGTVFHFILSTRCHANEA
jgi:C4-dicarboxylate-specific signal transduction histidine kinase